MTYSYEFGQKHGSDGKAFSQPEKDVLTEINKQKTEQEKLIKEKEKPQANPADLLAQEIKVKEHELQIAKLERAKFHENNGNRYDKNMKDNYSPEQRTQLNRLHQSVTRRENAISELRQQMQIIQKNPSSRAISTKMQ